MQFRENNNKNQQEYNLQNRPKKNRIMNFRYSNEEQGNSFQQSFEFQKLNPNRRQNTSHLLSPTSCFSKDKNSYSNSLRNLPQNPKNTVGNESNGGNFLKINHQKKITIKSCSNNNEITRSPGRLKPMEIKLKSSSCEDQKLISPINLSSKIKIPSIRTKIIKLVAQTNQDIFSAKNKVVNVKDSPVKEFKDKKPKGMKIQKRTRGKSDVKKRFNRDGGKNRTSYSNKLQSILKRKISSPHQMFSKKKMQLKLNNIKRNSSPYPSHGKSNSRSITKNSTNLKNGLKVNEKKIAGSYTQTFQNKSERSSFTSNLQINKLSPQNNVKRRMTQSHYKKINDTEIQLRNSSFNISKDHLFNGKGQKNVFSNSKKQSGDSFNSKNFDIIYEKNGKLEESMNFFNDTNQKVTSPNDSKLFDDLGKTACFGLNHNPQTETSKITQGKCESSKKVKSKLSKSEFDVNRLKNEILRYKQLYQNLSKQLEKANKNHLEEIEMMRKNHISELNSLENEFKQLEKTQLSFEDKIHEKQSEIDNLHKKIKKMLLKNEKLEMNLKAEKIKFESEKKKIQCDKEKEIQRFSKLAEEYQNESLKIQQVDHARLQEMEDLMEQLTMINENLTKENQFLKYRLDQKNSIIKSKQKLDLEQEESPRFSLAFETQETSFIADQIIVNNQSEPEVDLYEQRPSIQFPMKSFLPIASKIHLPNDTIEEVDEESEQSPAKEDSMLDKNKETHVDVFQILPHLKISKKTENKRNPYLDISIKKSDQNLKKLKHQVSFGGPGANSLTHVKYEAKEAQYHQGISSKNNNGLKLFKEDMEESFEYSQNHFILNEEVITRNVEEQDIRVSEKSGLNYALEPSNIFDPSQPQRQFATVKPNIIESEIEESSQSNESIQKEYLKNFTKQFIDEILNLKKEIVELRRENHANLSPNKNNLSQKVDNPYIKKLNTTEINKSSLEKKLMRAEISKLRAQNAALILYQKSQKTKDRNKMDSLDSPKGDSEMVEEAIQVIMDEVNNIDGKEGALSELERSELSANIKNYFKSIDSFTKIQQTSKKEQNSINPIPENSNNGFVNFKSIVRSNETTSENMKFLKQVKENQNLEIGFTSNTPGNGEKQLNDSFGIPTSKKEIGVKKSTKSLHEDYTSDFTKSYKLENQNIHMHSEEANKKEEYVQSMFKELKMKMERLASDNAKISDKLSDEEKRDSFRSMTSLKNFKTPGSECQEFQT